ncbi:unnamed protein product [Rodentolepis nana]|uniref:Ovule protein n=1 Tax=Rodentolepis nana TaxID=102285 RepID=A0A0R3T101_RODNA|nr:unnamed protein product [Rodentolepis nana]
MQAHAGIFRPWLVATKHPFNMNVEHRSLHMEEHPTGRSSMEQILPQVHKHAGSPQSYFLQLQKSGLNSSNTYPIL